MTTPALLEPLDRTTPFEWRGNLVTIGAVQLSAHQWGGAFRAHTEAVESVFTTAFPLTEVSSEAIDSGTAVPVVKDRSTWMVSPNRAGEFRQGTGFSALQLSVLESDMEAALLALSGAAALKSPIRFEPAMPLDSGVGARLQRLVRFLAEELDREPAAFAAPVVAARLADSVVYTLLLGHPHNHVALLTATESAEPPHVRRAAEYLDAHAGEAIRMADLTRLTGMNLRTLQRAFQKNRGCSPMEFLKQRRLHLAREKLLEHPDRTVTEVALDCGFVNVGRFSAAYRERFGELPSETRAARRRA